MSNLAKEILAMGSNANNNQLIRNGIILLDFLAFNALFALYVGFDWAEVLAKGYSRTMLFLSMNIAFAIGQFFFSNVIHNRRSTTADMIRQVFLLVTVFVVVAILVIGLVSEREETPSPSVWFTVWFSLMLFVLLVALRRVETALLRRYWPEHDKRHILFIGSGAGLLRIYKYFSDDPSLGFVMDGYFADSRLEGGPETFSYKGTVEDLEKMIADGREMDINEIYCDLPLDEKGSLRRIMKYCNDHVIHFYYVPSFGNVFGQSLTQERIGGMTVFANYGGPLILAYNKFVKRAFDVAVSSAVLLVLLPFIPIIALIIHLQSPGPIFFKQVRTGLDGRNFVCYKFRSMHVNKDADTRQATEHDPRKFAFGDFMRKANIDELPQFWNVLKGDMSVVGPRPHMLAHTEQYRQLIDKYMVRHFVKPGITGWAQVTGFRGETKELWQMEERVKRDIWYIENWSFWLDISICLKTFTQVFKHDKNAY